MNACEICGVVVRRRRLLTLIHRGFKLLSGVHMVNWVRPPILLTVVRLRSILLDFRVFSNKDVKIVGTSDPLSIGQ